MDIGQALGEEIQRRTGDETMISDLTYDLRSGDPDALDQIVAITFAQRRRGPDPRGEFTDGWSASKAASTRTRRCPTPSSGRATVDVDKLYNLGRYRPHYSGKIGSPLFLTAVNS